MYHCYNGVMVSGFICLEVLTQVSGKTISHLFLESEANKSCPCVTSRLLWSVFSCRVLILPTLVLYQPQPLVQRIEILRAWVA